MAKEYATERWKRDYEKHRGELHLPPIDDATEQFFGRLSAYQFSDHHILLIAQAMVNARVAVIGCDNLELMLRHEAVMG
jgi:hypothetical protein